MLYIWCMARTNIDIDDELWEELEELKEGYARLKAERENAPA